VLRTLDLNIAAIRKDVAENAFSILRPAEFEQLCEAARQEWLMALQTSEMKPPRKSFSYPDLVGGPWRKLAISSTNGIGEPYAQFLQSMYFDHQRSAYPNLNRLFKFVIELRNELMDVRKDFGDDPDRDGFWNACRVHHYPSGGGFMVMHRDTFFPKALGEYSFYQLLVPFSVKGRDFTSGGGVVVDKNGVKHNTDEIGGLGSILVYDGRTLHGVEDVDPEEIVDFNSPRGRLSIVCNPYCKKIPERIDK
jgi:hypothetical protein